MRKITASILLLVFLFNSIGFVNVYQFLHHKTSRMTRRAQSQQEDMLEVTLNSQNDGLEERGFKKIGLREYLYRGRRYDLLNIDVEQERTVIHLVHDSYEEDFLEFLTSFFDNNSQQAGDLSSKVVSKSISKRYLASRYWFKKIDEKVHRYYQEESVGTSSPFLETAVPPPKAA